jgi:hypothetical protein
LSAPIKKKYVPHKVLREGAIYFSVADSQYVLALRPVIAKVSRVLDDNGNPATAPDGTPQYWVEWNQVITTLTKEEWNVHKQMEDMT